LAADGARGVPCTIDLAPAATLLVPYFSVDTSQCGNPQLTTLVSVINTRLDPVLTHVTVWSNAAVAVAGFDLYLQGYDQQDFDLAALICNGAVPSTGPSTSPSGSYSVAPVSFPNCGDPVAGALSPGGIADLQAYLEGNPAPSTGKCAGVQTGGLAEGYLTIDVVDQCSNLDPSQPAYYAGILGFANVLAGEYQVVDPLNNFAEGFEAVHIEADTTDFNPGDVTFYGRYNNATAVDAREPLGTAYRIPYDLSLVTTGSTRLFVWRETDGALAPFTCGTFPVWWKLPLPAFVAFPDQDTAGLGGLPAHAELPLATQGISLGQEARFHPKSGETGWVYVNLQHEVSAYASSLRVGQGWVSGVRSTEGRFSDGLHAVQLDSACVPASFSYLTPGRTTTDPAEQP